jgi:hypothetical protein
MGKNRREQLINELTEIILMSHGFDDEDNDTEWDADNEDSQYSIIRDDVEIIVDTLEQRRLLL